MTSPTKLAEALEAHVGIFDGKHNPELAQPISVVLVHEAATLLRNLPSVDREGDREKLQGLLRLGQTGWEQHANNIFNSGVERAAEALGIRLEKKENPNHHVCGLHGFAPDRGDRCEACAAALGISLEEGG